MGTDGSKMSRKNPYYMSVNRRRELKYFCLQYKEWKRYLEHYHLRNDNNEWSDPTGEEATHRALCEAKIKLVEDTVRKTTREFDKYLFMAVTENLTDKQLITKYKLPLNKNDFQKMRQKFFYLLSQEKHMF